MNIDELIQRIEHGQTTAADARVVAPLLGYAIALAEASWDDGAAWTIYNRLRAAARPFITDIPHEVDDDRI